MFIKSLTVKNFRCFTDKTIEGLNVPDGTPGSGLNIFIGENGNGKTTILEAINFLTQSSYTSNNLMDVGDFNDLGQGIEIDYTADQNFSCKMPPNYHGGNYEANGIKFTAKTRTSKSPGKLLSSPFQASAMFKNTTTNYMKANGDDSGTAIADYYRTYNAESVIDDELNIFYFDKNRTRQLTQGNYKTTFERICDDLNWRFVKGINGDAAQKQAIVDSLPGDYFQLAKDTAQTGIGSKVATDLAEFFGNDKYKDLKVDIVNYLSPFSTGLLALRKDDALPQILSKDLGSGVEMIIALLMLKGISGASGGKIVYLIDEPEAHLHPKAQRELLNLLMEESKDKQMFLSTHSPYIFKDAITTKAGLFVFKRDANDEVQITDARTANFGHFPWSPSWGEVNFSAYDLPTVELHNELYGFIQEQTGNLTESQVETYFGTKGAATSKQWIKLSSGVAQTPYAVTLYTYIRNRIHHPENTHNADYTDAELRQSITEMLALIDGGL